MCHYYNFCTQLTADLHLYCKILKQLTTTFSRIAPTWQEHVLVQASEHPLTLPGTTQKWLITIKHIKKKSPLKVLSVRTKEMSISTKKDLIQKPITKANRSTNRNMHEITRHFNITLLVRSWCLRLNKLILIFDGDYLTCRTRPNDKMFYHISIFIGNTSILQLAKIETCLINM